MSGESNLTAPRFTNSLLSPETSGPLSTFSGRAVSPEPVQGETTRFTPRPTSPDADDGAAPAGAATLPCAPRILDAYFARKVVTETAGADGAAATTSVALERIDEHVLGRVVYVVVDVELCSPSTAAGTQVTITLRANDDRLTGTARQALRTTDGTADVETRTVGIGVTTALNDKDGSCAYTNLATFASKAIFKVTLRPHARADFDAWARRIAAATEPPTVGIDAAAAGVQAYFPANGARLLQLINRKVYEIHHPSNLYNFLGTHTYNGATVRRRISSIQNTSTDKVRYYFFNRIDNTHQICEVTQTRVRRRANGVTIARTSADANIPRGYIESGGTAGGDAAMNYYYNAPGSGDTTRKTPLSSYHRIVTRDNPNGSNRDYGVKQYDLANPNDPNDMVDLVRMPDDLNHDQETGANRVRATFTWSGTQRRYANPGCFAGFLGALIQLARTDVRCTGMCFGDATSYPSVSHPNGDSVDTGYLTAATEQSKVNAFRDHYFVNILAGNEGFKGALTGVTHRADHNDHLHAGDFDSARVVVQNPAT